jgi:polynucleotide 5'-hydroxyl-kinase GRC3/NOL9
LETIIVKGPIFLKIRGECEILGVKFKNTFILYNNNKYLPIEKDTDAKITIKNGFNYFELKKNTRLDQKEIGTRIWNNIFNFITKTNRNKIIIIGPSDAGKSTLTLFIANKLINKGFKPLIIDSDIGQGELAPPTCIGSTIMSKQTIDLTRVKPHYINFIGSIQPIGYESRIINCIIRSFDKLNKNNHITLINTDGYVSDVEKNYKIDLIKKIEPDCIICMGENGQTIDLFNTIKEKFSDNSNLKIIQGQSSIKETRKSIYDRREKRLIKYSNLLKKFTNEMMIPIRNINAIYYNNKFFLFKRISDMDESNKIETDSKIIEDLLMDNTFIEDRFIGLSLKEDYEKIIGFGIIKKFDNGFFLIRTSINRFDYIFLSDIKLYINNNTLLN